MFYLACILFFSLCTAFDHQLNDLLSDFRYSQQARRVLDDRLDYAERAEACTLLYENFPDHLGVLYHKMSFAALLDDVEGGMADCAQLQRLTTDPEVVSKCAAVRKHSEELPQLREKAEREENALPDSQFFHRWKPLKHLKDYDLQGAEIDYEHLVSRWTEMGAAPELRESSETAYRAHAVNTGVLDGVYSLSEDTITLLVATGVPVPDAFYTVAHREALQYGQVRNPVKINDIVADTTVVMRTIDEKIKEGQLEMTEDYVKWLHRALTHHTPYRRGRDPMGIPVWQSVAPGQYKVQANSLHRSDGRLHQFAPPAEIEGEMKRFISMLQQLDHQKMNPIVAAAWAHHAFVNIHPFRDANGRVARAIASTLLMKAGLPPLVVKAHQRQEYLTALESANLLNVHPLAELFNTCMETLLDEIEGGAGPHDKFFESEGIQWDTMDPEVGEMVYDELLHGDEDGQEDF
eukprot:TRINITY_DN57672_c0_g1_i1.p1 TRINITY_DN57672_c0_g1~~TRINITY_DN57672_c0_g1_i1.p1  ORF type:complete len:463 (+),score=43.66 TRINITY_DN57672_c0_g1_i1:16-1404(+)